MNITIHGFVQDRGLLPARGGRMGPHMMECYSDVTMTEWTHKICPNTSGPQQTGKHRYILILLPLHLLIWLSSLVSDFHCEIQRSELQGNWVPLHCCKAQHSGDLKSHCLWRCRVGTCKCLPQRGGWCLWCLYFVFQQMDAGLWLPRYASQ